MKKKKWKDIRSAVTMMCVMLAMISTATYAWFTLADNATVTGLQMTAVTNGGLLVSTNRSAWSNAVDLRTDGEETHVLTPVSVVTKIPIQLSGTNEKFMAPQLQMPYYSDAFTVTQLYDATGNAGDNAIYNLTAANLGEKAVKKTFYIKEGEEQPASVAIQMADAEAIATQLKASGSTAVGLTNGKPNYDGSFVVLDQGSYTNTDTAIDDALEAVRIGFVIYSDESTTGSMAATLKVWEPNCELGVENTATFAKNQLNDEGTITAVTPDVSSKYASGTITNTNGFSTNDTTSVALFDIAAGDTDGVRVDVYMWFEGQDPSCVNEIMADSIIAQLKFVTVSTTSATD